MRIPSLLLSSLLLISASAQVADKFVPFPYESQSIGGLLGQRMQINLEKRLLQVDERGLLAGFEQRPGAQAWIGEHIGKYLDAAANTWAVTKDPRLRQQMDRMVSALLKTQLEDGYLGTYKAEDRWTSWDVWVHKYNLLGLLAYYRISGDARALTAARRIGDLLAATFGEGKRDIIASSTHAGMAATSVLEPIVLLYRETKEPRYLDFARYIVRSWEQPNGPKLVSSLLSHGSVHKTANAKAYEMMSDLVGVLELYRVTGERDYLTIATRAWDDIVARRLYVTGTVSTHEHFQDDLVLPGEPVNDTGEGCATVTWLQLNWQLLRLTGETKYAEQLERTVYNQLLAAQDPATGRICYFTPLNGKKEPRTSINCCQSSEPRGISMIPQLTWGAYDGGVAVELYTDAQVSTTIAAIPVKLAIATSFPETGYVTIKVNPQRPVKFPIYLRIPAWTGKATVDDGDKTWATNPGQYLKLDKTWKPGDRIILSFDMTVQRLDGGKSYPGFEGVRRGPEILVLDKTRNPQLPWLHQAAITEWPDRLIAIDRTYVLPGKAVLSNPLRTEFTKLKLIPFSDAVEYRVWLASPSRLALSMPSVLAFGKESSSSRGSDSFGSICDERPETWRTTQKAKGDSDDWWAVEIPAERVVSRLVFRHGHASAEGGWFDTASGKPTIQIRRSSTAEWETVGRLDAYPELNSSSVPSLEDGQPYEFRFPGPTPVQGIRIRARPGRNFSSCAELAAYE